LSGDNGDSFEVQFFHELRRNEKVRDGLEGGKKHTLVDNAAKSVIVSDLVLNRLVAYVTLNGIATKSIEVLCEEDE